VFKIPKMNIPNSVDDRQVQESIRQLDALPIVPAPEFDKWQPRHIVKLSEEPASSGRLSETELQFIQAIIASPGKPSSTYAKVARIGGQRAAEIRKRLTASGYLREYTVATGQRGRDAIVLEPLDPAYAAVDRTNKGDTS